MPWYTDPDWNRLSRPEWKVKPGEGQLVGRPSKSLRTYALLDPKTPEQIKLMNIDHLFMITIVKSIEQRGNGVVLSYAARKKQKGFGGQATPVKVGPTYFRLHLVQNVLSPIGEMFYIIEQSTSVEKIWGTGNTHNYECMYGRVFLMALSSNTIAHMANNTNVVSPHYSLRELDLQIFDYPVIPLVKWGVSSLYDSWGFCVQNIKVYAYGLRLHTSVCSGRYCDRRDTSIEAKTCACYTANQDRDMNKLTMEVYLRAFKEDSPEQLKDDIHTKYRSYSLFKWLLPEGRIPAEMQADDQSAKFRLDLALQSMLTYVNDKSGFTIVGWTTRGEVSDHNDAEAEKLRSDDLTVHIARLVPTCLTSLDKEHMKTLLYNPTAAVGDDLEGDVDYDAFREDEERIEYERRAQEAAERSGQEGKTEEA